MMFVTGVLAAWSRGDSREGACPDAFLGLQMGDKQNPYNQFPIPLSEVRWIEADRNYVHIHSSNGTHRMRERIGHLETLLDPGCFARIHRSAIVNLDCVRELQNWFSGDSILILDDGTRLVLSRSYRDAVESRLNV